MVAWRVNNVRRMKEATVLKDNLRRYREKRGLSQQQLADELHVVRQTVSKWERGTSVPDADLLVATRCRPLSMRQAWRWRRDC